MKRLFLACQNISCRAGARLCGGDGAAKAILGGRPHAAPAALSIILAALATGLSGGCGGGDEAREIGMRDLRFSPRDATVRVGQRVTWRNEDDAPHNVVAVRAGFRSGLIRSEGTYSKILDRPGLVHYVCTLHPGMRGTLRVSP